MVTQRFVFLALILSSLPFNVASIGSKLYDYDDGSKSQLDAFFEAAALGNTTGVLAFLRAGIPVDAVDAKQLRYYTALTYAAENGHVETVQALISRNATINPPASIGYSALMRASEMGQPAVVRLLLERGANPNGQEASFRMTALMYAAKGERGGIIGIEMSKTVEVVRLLLQYRANVNAFNFLHENALMRAASAGKLPVVDMLLERGAEIDETDESDTSAIMYAARNHHSAIVKLLLKRGAITAGCLRRNCADE